MNSTTRKIKMQKGFISADLLAILIIFGIVGCVICGMYSSTLSESRIAVSDIAAVEYLEGRGYKNVRLIEVYRFNPQNMGCMPAENAAFRLNGYDTEGMIFRESVHLCCLGSVGETPRCVILSENK